MLPARIEASSPADFTVYVGTARGLTRFAVLFVIDLATRRVAIAGIIGEPDSAWVIQCAVNSPIRMMDACAGNPSSSMIAIDASPMRLLRRWRGGGVETVRRPHRSPNLNAYANAS